MLLPYVDQAPLYESINFDINACCNGPNNDALLNNVKIAAFRCPSDSPPSNMGAPNNYAVCMGPNFGFSADVNQGQQNGAFNRHQVVNFAAITDGTSNVLAASELITTDQGGAPGSQEELSRVRNGQSITNEYANPRAWPRGGTPAITEADVTGWATAGAGITSINQNRVGDKWFHGEPMRTAYNTLLTPNSTYPNVSFHCSGCHYDGGGLFGARSKHTGGVHALLCDGAVRFISENIDWTTYQALGGRNDGTEVGDF